MKVTKREAYAEAAIALDALVESYESDEETDERRKALAPLLRRVAEELWAKARARERKA